jgi:uncharacterized membrane protein
VPCPARLKKSLGVYNENEIVTLWWKLKATWHLGRGTPSNWRGVHASGYLILAILAAIGFLLALIYRTQQWELLLALAVALVISLWLWNKLLPEAVWRQYVHNTLFPHPRSKDRNDI